ncbi:MAG: hypothetical protein LBE70_02715 [Nitrososphaerota archaeon]|nr:hypothetical protein [Nitrososphaerota archaeon]
MSSNKEKLIQLSEKVDELVGIINKITEELKAVSVSIKLFSVSQNQTQTTTTTALNTTTSITSPQLNATSIPSSAEVNSIITSQTETRLRTIDDVRMSFPEDLEVKLVFEDNGNYISVKPKQFLGSDNFAKIASAIRGMSGEYISAGKDSHFRIPKKKPPN